MWNRFLIALVFVGILTVPAHAAFKLSAPEKISLKNGLTVYYLKNDETPLVSFRIVIGSAGTAFDKAAEEGLADLTATLLLKGTGTRSAAELAEALDFLGASLDVQARDEYTEVTGSALSERLPDLLGLTAECLTAPAFTSDEFEKERLRRLDAIKAVKDEPSSAVRYYFRKAYFGAHALGNLSLGSEESLRNAGIELVKSYFAARYRPDRSVMAVVGSIEKEDLIRLLDSSLAAWKNPGRSAGAEAIAVPQAPDGKKLILIDKPDATQAYFIIGAPGLAMGDKQSAPYSVMNTLVGGRFTSRLNTELRIKRGLTYGVRSSMESWRRSGLWTVYSYTKNDKIGEMLDIMFELLKKAKSDGFSGEEAESARNYILGQFPPTLEGNMSKALAYSNLVFYNLGLDYYDKYLERISGASPEDLLKMAGKIIPEDRFVMVVVGKADEIRDQLSRFGRFEERKITDPGF